MTRARLAPSLPPRSCAVGRVAALQRGGVGGSCGGSKSSESSPGFGSSPRQGHRCSVSLLDRRAVRIRNLAENDDDRSDRNQSESDAWQAGDSRHAHHCRAHPAKVGRGRHGSGAPGRHTRTSPRMIFRRPSRMQPMRLHTKTMSCWIQGVNALSGGRELRFPSGASITGRRRDVSAVAELASGSEDDVVIEMAFASSEVRLQKTEISDSSSTQRQSPLLASSCCGFRQPHALVCRLSWSIS